MPEVKIILTAEQKQAIAAFNQLRNQVNVSKDAFQALSQAGAAFGNQISSQITSGVASISTALKAMAGSARLGAGALTAYAVGAGIVFLGWKKAIDEVRESMKALEDEAAKNKADSEWESKRKDLLKYVDTLKQQKLISENESVDLTGKILTANDSSSRNAVLSALQGQRRVLVEARDKQKADAETAVTELVNSFKIQTLDGIDKERAQIQKEVDDFVNKASELLDKIYPGKTNYDTTPLKARLDEVNSIATQVLANRIGEAEAEKARKSLEQQQQITREIREREKRADEFYKREEEHEQRLLEYERQKQIQAVERNQFLTDSEKFDSLVSLGVDTSGIADPSSFTQQISAGLVQLQNQFGTFSQASASLLTNGIGTAVQGISDGIMGLIDGTRTWAQTWGSVLRTMAAQGIQFMVEQTAAFLLNKAKQVVIHIAGEKAMTAATLFNAAARAAAGIKEAVLWIVKAGAKAASSVADIPYVGWALALAAFAGVVAAGMKELDGARELGGPVRSGGSYLVGESGPELFVPQSNGTILSNAQTMQLASSRDSGNQNSSESGIGSMKVVVVQSLQQAMDEYLNSPRAEKVIIQTVDGRRLDLGLET